METDLHAVIRANILEPVHKQFIVYQCLKALLYCHSGGLVHRDLKPSNLLLNEECLCKVARGHFIKEARRGGRRGSARSEFRLDARQVADFGLARSLLKPINGTLDDPDGPGAPILTDYVATRWYRAPEILLGSTRYGKAVDLWSLGCIFGEMLAGKPLFQGSSTLNQLERICEIVGRPSPDEVASMRSPFASTMLDNIKVSSSASGSGLFGKWSDTYAKAGPEAMDLLEKLMQWDPSKRLTALEGMSHPYCKQFIETDPHCTDPLRRVAARHVSTPFDDNDKKTTQVYRERLYEEIHRKGSSRGSSGSRVWGSKR